MHTLIFLVILFFSGVSAIYANTHILFPSSQNPQSHHIPFAFSLPREKFINSATNFTFFSSSFNDPLMGKSGVLDLENHFAFYGAYHSNPINIFIHLIFVWPILFTLLVILYFTPPLFNLPAIQFSARGLDTVLFFNIGSFLTVIYSVFYICMDVKAGSLAAFFCTSCLVSSSVLASWLGFSLAWKVVLVAQIVCWTGQFIGHGVFEKRAPALLDNLVQAFVMAPFFVLLEALQMFFHYEPYPGFQASVEAKIERERKAWQEKKKQK